MNSAPEGWKLVPVVPTEAMIDAAREHHEGEPYLPVSLYKAMLAAAPDVKGGPVAWQLRTPEGRVILNKEFPAWADGGDGYKITPLYTATQPAEQQPDVSALVEALDGAARSLETISKQSGIDEYMRDFLEVRGYARNRAMVAFEALSSYRKQGGES